MACQYFVGGRWVSENEFKALLNEGLLDTLVANNKLAVKGFKVDSSKVKLSQPTTTITRTNVPAVKLAEILAKEIKARQEYPLNMLSALELTPDLQDFKIPLWASPEAAKFESLLTSLISNKVVKQKFNGNSYVLGSEEGFKVKEGDKAAGDLKNSNIVFSSKFDPTKGLQPLRVDKKTGKILPAQIMIPFKFRNERGEILDMKEFIIEGEDGRQMLDTDKIPDKLLQLFGFRIPTQERNSMAAVEIVGFLPEAMGDLMLAPRDFTKQMGSDFDVDKLYTYMYNHFYLNGKLYTNFLGDSKKIETQLAIAKESLQELKDNLKLSKEEARILNDYIKNTIDSAAENEEGDKALAEQANEIINKAKGLDPTALNTLIDRISVLNRSYVAARQNKILDIHLDVMTSSNPEVIASIIARDGSGEFAGLASTVNEIRSEKGSNPTPLTILSDIYQRTKYINATAGKNGVGSFSLDSTFNAVSQGKDLVLKNLDEAADEDLFGTPMMPKTPTAAQVLAANQDVAVFGDVVSKGDLSNKYTLRSQQVIDKAKAEKRELTKDEKESLKLKSTIIRTLQSTAVDNEKEQILDKLNINDETFGVVRAMALLGFEEADIAGLITQDIIWEYLAKVRANRSSLSKYNPNFEQELQEELTKKYDPEGLIAKASETQLATYSKLADISGEELIENLKKEIDPAKSTDVGIRQLMILQKFQKLDNIGGEIVKVQSAINSESRGVPKSLLETSTKVTQGKNLKFSPIFNADTLLGTVDSNGNITPTTINGYAFKYGTEFANNIYQKYFPYEQPGFNTVVREVLKHVANGDIITSSTARLNEVTSEITNDIRSYFYGNQSTNLFIGNPDEEAKRLFIDEEGKNLSLASILQALSSQPWFSKNQFLNKLTPNINTNGTVSRINFEASTAANFDERAIYDGFAYLLSKNVPLGEFNGIQYTSRTLAQDLVTAAFLEGGNQGAKQYLRYVPVSYLKTLGFGEYLGSINFDFVGTFEGNLDGNGQVIYSMPSAFTRQYIQNNPEVVKTVDLSDTGSKSIPSKFTLLPKSLEANFVEVVDPATGEITKTQTHFLSIRDPKANSNYALYEFNEVKRQYERIPILKGTYGFTQYNSQTTLVEPIQKQEKVKPTKPEINAPGMSITAQPVQPTKNFNPNVVNNTAPVTQPNLLGANTNLKGKEALDDLISRLLQDRSLSKLHHVLLDKLSGLTLPEGFKFAYSKDAGVKGNYNYNTKTLTINLNNVTHKDINDIANTLTHELVHAFTGDSIRKYINGNLDLLSKEEIAAIDELESLRMSYLTYLNKEGGAEEIKQFMARYETWRNSDPATRQAFATPQEISKYYGGIKLTEFVTMALTDAGFQAYLSNIKIDNKSLLDQIKDLLLDILNAIGLGANPGTMLAGAVKSSIDLIDSVQKRQIYEDVFYTTEEVEAMRGGLQPTDTINIYAGTGENAELSNFAIRPFKSVVTVNTTFNTVEGAFQAAKFRYSSAGIGDRLPTILELANTTGAKAKALGRTIPGLDTKAWDENSSQIMKALLKESFEQNPDALAKLLATGDATLTHTQDKGKWGKEFPKLLMEVREELKATQQPAQPKKSLLDMSKATNPEQFKKAFEPGFKEEDNRPSQDDWDAYNAMRANDEMLMARELDEDMYQKYLLICGK